MSNVEGNLSVRDFFNTEGLLKSTICAFASLAPLREISFIVFDLSADCVLQCHNTGRKLFCLHEL
jgi:hypothetical protein